MGASILVLGATLGSLTLFGSSAATAAGGPDTVAGGAFGASLTGLLTVLAPTPTVTLPADGTAQHATLLSLPLSPVATSGTLIADTAATNATQATEQVTSSAEIEAASVLVAAGITGIKADAVTSTCQSNAAGSTGSFSILGLSIAGTTVIAPTTLNTFLPTSALGPLSGLVSIEVNVQKVSNVIHSTSITNDAIVITLLGAVGGGETVDLAHSDCAAAGPDIDVPPTVTGVVPSSGPTAGGTTVTISGSGFACVTGVKFGTTPAASFTVVSPTQITAVSPAGAAGTIDVTVTNCFGTSPTGTADQFTYIATAGVPIAPVAPLSNPVAVTG
ncbi:MAG TPA: IPT/TIG domain-containing protein [Acidimicrobiales bacterium]|nr:IPT/TIG domain-containing protein [Acidimicrobiales bacterium]